MFKKANLDSFFACNNELTSAKMKKECSVTALMMHIIQLHDGSDN